MRFRNIVEMFVCEIYYNPSGTYTEVGEDDVLGSSQNWEFFKVYYKTDGPVDIGGGIAGDGLTIRAQGSSGPYVMFQFGSDISRLDQFQLTTDPSIGPGPFKFLLPEGEGYKTFVRDDIFFDP